MHISQDLKINFNLKKMNDQKRRFRPRPQRGGFRPEITVGKSNGHFQSNSNGNMSRNNGSMTNPFNVEKAAQKYQQLAKDALTVVIQFIMKIIFSMPNILTKII